MGLCEYAFEIMNVIRHTFQVMPPYDYKRAHYFYQKNYYKANK